MINLRKFSPEDLEKVTAIAKVSFPGNQSISRENFKEWSDKYRETFFVAEENKEVIGYGVAGVKDDLPKVINMAVDPDFRGRGVGTSIIRNFIGCFKNGGEKEIFLKVRTRNTGAIDLYKNCGFEILETKKGCYSNGNDGHIMKMKTGLM